jgi:hypothetical protein
MSGTESRRRFLTVQESRTRVLKPGFFPFSKEKEISKGKRKFQSRMEFPKEKENSKVEWIYQRRKKIPK